MSISRKELIRNSRHVYVFLILCVSCSCSVMYYHQVKKLDNNIETHASMKPMVESVCEEYRGYQVFMLGEQSHIEKNCADIKREFVKQLVEQHDSLLLCIEYDFYTVYRLNQVLSEVPDSVETRCLVDSIIGMNNLLPDYRLMDMLREKKRAGKKVVLYGLDIPSHPLDMYLLIRELSRQKPGIYKRWMRYSLSLYTDVIKKTEYIDSCNDILESFRQDSNFSHINVPQNILQYTLKLYQEALRSYRHEVVDCTSKSTPYYKFFIRDSLMMRNFLHARQLFTGYFTIVSLSNYHLTPNLGCIDNTDACKEKTFIQYLPVELRKSTVILPIIYNKGAVGFKYDGRVHENPRAGRYTLNNYLHKRHSNYAYVSFRSPLRREKFKFKMEPLLRKGAVANWTEIYNGVLYTDRALPFDENEKEFGLVKWMEQVLEWKKEVGEY